ncbi:hypothetical protein BKA93DRAFT_712769, partial [Sparassis latifolia]
YNNLCHSFAALFSWIEQTLKEQLPELYGSLAIYADVLPGNTASPVYPFSGFVVNLNVATRPHRDVKDLNVCLVLVIGSHIGGELCLVEPGLVL